MKEPGMDDENPDEVEDLGKPLGWRITVGARTVEVFFKSLGPMDEARLSAAYNKLFGERLSLATLMSNEDSIGMHTVAALWWLARVNEGERKLTLEDAFKEFPHYDEIDGVEFEMVYEDDPEDGSPEA
jgi:hypothetical protein